MFKQRYNSFKYAIAGIREVFDSQVNMKIHFVIACMCVVAGFYFSLSHIEWCLIVVAIMAVFSAELFNTSIEHLTDLVSPEHHPLAGKAKDAAAGGVLIAAVGALIIGLLVFLPKVF